MTLFSLNFLIFLFITCAIYFLVSKDYRWIVLLISGYVFYCWGGGYKTVVFLLVTTAVSFFAAILMQRELDAFNEKKSQEGANQKELKKLTQKKNRRILLVSLLIIFGILGRIKYGSFLFSIIAPIFSPGGEGASIRSILLPLGISFYSFQSAGYLMDVYRGKVKADRNIAKYALFVSYFPQIVQGPISRYSDLAKELYAGHDFDYGRVVRGAERIIWGYMKKLVIADRIAVIVKEVFNNYGTEGYAGFTIFMGAIFYGIQIYADFSGGIDIILGISETLGIKQVENFRQPYMARSVTEFWQRWHMTLGHWMRDYVFYPIALSKTFGKLTKAARKTLGNEKGKIAPSVLASFIVFLLVGIWHGAAWKYVVFGIFQAIFVSSGTLFETNYARMRERFKISDESKAFNIFRMIRTIIILTFGRMLARAATLTSAFEMWKLTFASFNPEVLFNNTFLNMGLSVKNYILMWIMIVVLFIVDYVHERGISIRDKLSEQHIVIRYLVVLGAIFFIIVFGIYGPGVDANMFIYQGF